LKNEDLSQPGFEGVLDRTIESIWISSVDQQKNIQHIVQSEMLDHLMNLAVNERGYDDVRAICFDRLRKLQIRIKGKDFKEDLFYKYVDMRISDFLDDPEEYKPTQIIKAPDGSPIGSCDF